MDNIVIPKTLIKTNGLFGITIFLGDISNNYVLAKMKIWTKGDKQALRFVASTLVGQVVNTAFFYTFGLWGLISSTFLIQSVLTASLAKILVEVVMLPVTMWFANRLKRIEGVDVFDRDTDFNPMRF